MDAIARSFSASPLIRERTRRRRPVLARKRRCHGPEPPPVVVVPMFHAPQWPPSWLVQSFASPNCAQPRRTRRGNSRVDDANSCSLPSAPSRADLAAGIMGARMTCSPRIHLLSCGPGAAMVVLALDPLLPAPSPTSSRMQ